MHSDNLYRISFQLSSFSLLEYTGIACQRTCIELQNLRLGITLF